MVNLNSSCSAVFALAYWCLKCIAQTSVYFHGFPLILQLLSVHIYWSIFLFLAPWNCFSVSAFDVRGNIPLKYFINIRALHYISTTLFELLQLRWKGKFAFKVNSYFLSSFWKRHFFFWPFVHIRITTEGKKRLFTLQRGAAVLYNQLLFALFTPSLITNRNTTPPRKS